MAREKTMKRHQPTIKRKPILLKKKRMLSVELPRRVMDGIDTVDGKVDAYLTGDTKDALAQTNAVDQRLAAGDGAPLTLIPNHLEKNCSLLVRKRIFLQLVFVLALLFLLLISSSATAERWPLVGAMLFFMGVVLAAVGSMGRLWCSVYIAGYKMNVLVMQGPYSMSRNPLYFFSLIGATGVALGTKTIMVPVLVLFAFAAYYPFVIKSEEAALLKRHGKTFAVYLQVVPRFFPKWSGLFEPNYYIIMPKVVKRHMIFALWFIWPLGFLQLIEMLHRLRMLPTFFGVY
jgi:protein-S-isoprenylcysteine O-methyltransferase Ste14